MYYERSYHLAPDERAEKAYALLIRDPGEEGPHRDREHHHPQEGAALRPAPQGRGADAGDALLPRRDPGPAGDGPRAGEDQRSRAGDGLRADRPPAKAVRPRGVQGPLPRGAAAADRGQARGPGGGEVAGAEGIQGDRPGRRAQAKRGSREEEQAEARGAVADPAGGTAARRGKSAEARARRDPRTRHRARRRRSSSTRRGTAPCSTRTDTMSPSATWTRRCGPARPPRRPLHQASTSCAISRGCRAGCCPTSPTGRSSSPGFPAASPGRASTRSTGTIRPAFARTVAIYSSHGETDGDYLICENLPTLLWLGQMAGLELHAWY